MAGQAQRLRQRLRAVATAFPERVSAIQKDLALEGLEGVSSVTMVDTGRLRQGWDVGVNGPSAYLPKEGSTGTADDPVRRGRVTIRKADKLAALFITNNVPYCAVWETGSFEPPDPGPSKGRGRKGTRRRRATEGVVLVSGGFHTAAPAGFLSSGLARIEAKLRNYEASGLGLKEAMRP